MPNTPPPLPRRNRQRPQQVADRSTPVVGALQAAPAGRPVISANPFVNRPLPMRPDERATRPLPLTPFQSSARHMPFGDNEDYEPLYEVPGGDNVLEDLTTLSSNTAYGAVNAAEVRRRVLTSRPLPGPPVPERPPVGTVVGSRSRQEAGDGSSRRLWGLYFKQSFEYNGHQQGLIESDSVSARAPNEGANTQHGRVSNIIDVGLTRATSLISTREAVRRRYVSGQQRPLVHIQPELFAMTRDGQKVPISSRRSVNLTGVADPTAGGVPQEVTLSQDLVSATSVPGSPGFDTALDALAHVAASTFAGESVNNTRETLAIRDTVSPWVRDIIRTNPDILNMDDPIMRTQALIAATKSQYRRSKALPVPGQATPLSDQEKIAQREYENTIMLLTQRLEQLEQNVADYVDDAGTEMRQ